VGRQVEVIAVPSLRAYLSVDDEAESSLPVSAKLSYVCLARTSCGPYAGPTHPERRPDRQSTTSFTPLLRTGAPRWVIRMPRP
jgi:hypothetical protein